MLLCWLGLGIALLVVGPALQAQDIPADREVEYEALARSAEPVIKQNQLLKKISRLVGPSVVHIEAESYSGGGGDRTQEAGSGVIFQRGAKYYVLSNRHVIKAALADGGATLQSGPNRRIRIELADGRKLYPRTVWAHAASDVAALEIRADDLIPAKFGDSDKLEVGDYVLAMGSPFALSQSVTFGIISALGRRDLDLEERVEFQDFVQVDAAINPGNSGGPLINLKGEVVGVNTAIASNSGGNEGIGFTIPSNMALSIAVRMIEQGRVEFGYMGIRLDTSFDAEQKHQLGLMRGGARITDVYPGTPAEQAGLKRGDIVLRFNEALVDDDRHLITKAKLAEIGSKARLRVLREREEFDATVVIGANAAQGSIRPTSTQTVREGE